MTQNDVNLVVTELLPELGGLLYAEAEIRAQLKDQTNEHRLKWVYVLNRLLDEIAMQELVIGKVMELDKFVARERKRR